MSRRRVIELEAHCRALKKQGARLAAERDAAYDQLEEIDRANLRIARLRQQVDDLEQMNSDLHDTRHRLLMKIKALKEGGSGENGEVRVWKP